MFDKKPTTKYQFCPQEDITAYELSKILPLMFGKYSEYNVREAVEKLPDNVKRHLRQGESEK